MSEQEFELYLKLLSRCLGLTAAQRGQIADELRDHLQERLEELARAGVPRDQAVIQALDEFGDASVLAAHFTTIARLRKRRLVMRLSLGSMAALAVALFMALALWPDNSPVQGPARVVGETTAVDEGPSPPVKVEVAQPIARDMPDFAEAFGVIVPSQTVEVRAQVTGYLEKSKLPVGGNVKQGDVLFHIDARRARADLARSEAEVQRAQAHADAAKKTYELIKAGSEAAQKAVSLIAVQQRWLEWKETAAELDAAKADLEVARFNLDCTRLTAPISGHLSRPAVDVGNLVAANTTRLATLVSLDPVTIEFGLSELSFYDLRESVRAGKLAESAIPVWFALGNETEFSHTAKLESMDFEVVKGTGNVRLHATMANPDLSLLVGLPCRVRVSTGKSCPALLVPAEAVSTDHPLGAGLITVVNDQGKLVHASVDIGPLEGNFRVIRSYPALQSAWVATKYIADLPLEAVEPVRTKLEP
jgi:membrane fusion protein, multidrug efflux system